MTDTAVPANPLHTTLRTPWGHAAVVVLASAGLVLNIIGGSGFPESAPIEDAMNAGISIDLGAAIVACGVGLVVALMAPRARPTVVFPWLGLGFSVIAFVAWVLNADGLFGTLFAGERGRYMFDTFGPFYFGIPWVLGAVFSAYGLRRRDSARGNAAAIAGLVIWAIMLVGAVASALLYGADLTD